MARTYMAPPDDERCECDRRPLSDGSEARCMLRKAKGSRYCARHTKIIYGWKPSEETRREMRYGNTLLKAARRPVSVVAAMGWVDE